MTDSSGGEVLEPLSDPQDSSESMKQQGSRIKRWEWVLLTGASILSLGSLSALILDFPVRSLFMDLSITSEGRAIGVFREVPGLAKRQRNQDHEFLSVASQDTVFDLDSVVTGPQSGLVIELNDGGTLTLGPNTMVRLSFGSGLGLNGIFRSGLVEILEGEASGLLTGAGALQLKSGSELIRVDVQSGQQKVRAPKGSVRLPQVEAPVVVPAPAPIALIPSLPELEGGDAIPDLREALRYAEVQAPRVRERLFLSDQDYSRAEGPALPLKFSWKTNLADGAGILQVQSADGVISLSERVVSQEGRAHQTVLLKRPGRYRWSLVNPETGKPALYQIDQGKPELAAEGEFEVWPEVISIQPAPPRFGANSSSTSEYQGGALLRSFNLKLGWNALKQVRGYWLEGVPSNQRMGSGSAVFRRKVQTNEIQLSAQEFSALGSGFRIRAIEKEASGFVRVSRSQQIGFDFVPPTLTEPKANTKFSLSKLTRQSNGALLLTWKKTHFTQSYELEIANDPEFKSRVLQRKLGDNFFLFKSKEPGKLYWRVRSLGESFDSTFSEARPVTLEP